MPSSEKANRPRHSRRGLSLLEMTVVLAVLAILLAVSVAAFQRPSASSVLEQRLSATAAALAKVRASAVQSGQPQRLRLDKDTCHGSAVEVVLYPDGTAEPTDLCFVLADAVREARVDPLTGQLVR